MSGSSLGRISMADSGPPPANEAVVASGVGPNAHTLPYSGREAAEARIRLRARELNWTDALTTIELLFGKGGCVPPQPNPFAAVAAFVLRPLLFARLSLFVGAR